MVAVRQIDALPIDIDAPVQDAAEDLGMIARLVTDFVSGTNRLDQPGEGLWMAAAHHRLIGIYGLNQDPFASPVMGMKHPPSRKGERSYLPRLECCNQSGHHLVHVTNDP